ncbi:centrosomal protein of 95 kDa-like [Thalassophryne amazonica]|uniref:centrosomal protein of 95 kDa-like n=1 Tax=Thalassophryne amazonica TaxID=390379 RepID=UPI001471955D|nr:centrosomal protein of 95 kDa-like [Thalassophryne amazonica]
MSFCCVSISSSLMWTQKEESDWVNVANDLLSKCHINKRLRKLTDCDANIFITLYETIVGEKVPDYIDVPSCQEDDVHNVQCVIDSLSLDYLQISLSHITGENVVRGDKVSIKNLLDIFEGLFEYLTEELQNEELNVSPHEDTPHITEKPISCNDIEPESKAEGASLPSSVESRCSFTSCPGLNILNSLIIVLLFCSSSVKQNEVLSVLLEELPYLQISPQTLGRMWEQQLQQVDRLHGITSSHNQRHRNLSSQLEETQRRHDTLVEIVRKDKEHKKRLKDIKEQARQQRSIQSALRERRQQVTRAKKYYNEYYVQHRARLMRARTKEEKMFRQLFEESLELQKLQLREQIAYAREQSLEHEKRCQDQIKSMENYFKDQFSLLAEKFQQEQQEIHVWKKAREKALLKLKQELRSRLVREICDLQKVIIKKDEEDHFKELEVQRLQNRVHMASFQYRTGCLY